MLKKTISPLVYQEISIVIYVNDLDDCCIKYDFLNYNKVVPLDWVIDSSRSNTQKDITVFDNSFTISKEYDKLIFSQGFNSYISEISDFVRVVNKYISVSRLLDCKKIEIRPTSFFRFDLNEEGNQAAEPYIYAKILSISGLEKYSKKPIKGNLSLNFILDKCQLNLEIQDMIFPLSQNTPERSGVFIYGNFCYEIIDDIENKQKKLLEIVAFCPENIQIYTDIVEAFVTNDSRRNVGWAGAHG
jgi:hypothetical protein